MRAAARDLGLELLLAPTEGGPPDSALHTILSDAHNPVDGILLMGVADRPADLAWLTDWGKPAVLLSRHLERHAARLCSSVGIDYEAGIRLPVDHLVERGHRAIAYAGPGGEGRDDWCSTLQRLDGFTAGLRVHGLTPDHVYPVAQDRPETWDEMAQLIRAGRITAIVCANDTVALEGRTRLLEHGVRSPADYEITGLDDVAEAAATGLTSVTSERDRVGRLGVELLHALVTDPVMSRQHTVLRPRLVVRGSTQSAGVP